MIILENAKKALEDAGYEVRLHTVDKNGVEKEALTVGNGVISPSMYEECFTNTDGSYIGDDKVVEFVKKALENVPAEGMFFAENIRDWEFAMTHLKLYVSPKTDSLRIKKDFLDLELYCRICDDVKQPKMTAVVTETLKKYWNVSEEEVFLAAEFNSRLYERSSLASMIAGMVDVPDDDDMPEMMPQMTVIQNPAVIADSIELENLSDEFGSFWIIPSSIYEVILLPDDDGADEHMLNAMVQEVNETQVVPEERLADHVYYYDADQHKLFLSKEDASEVA